MTPCRLDDLNAWLEDEAGGIAPDTQRRVILEVNANLEAFVKWPQRAELLWQGRHRKRERGQSQRYHRLPEVLKPLTKQYRFSDGRSNGPAILAYLVAGGDRPRRNTGKGWHIHHVYDGKFPYPRNDRPSLRAIHHPLHFTQSAGLVAVHPVADALADEFGVFAWRLRAEAFLRFGYDPEVAFSGTPDKYRDGATLQFGHVQHNFCHLTAPFP